MDEETRQSEEHAEEHQPEEHAEEPQPEGSGDHTEEHVFFKGSEFHKPPDDDVSPPTPLDELVDNNEPDENE